MPVQLTQVRLKQTTSKSTALSLAGIGRSSSLYLLFNGINATIVDNITCAHNASIDNFTTKTMAFWAYIRSAGGGNAGRIFLKGSNLLQLVSTGLMEYTAQFSGTNGVFSSAIVVPYNIWFHVAVTYDGGLTTNVPLYYFNGAVLNAATVNTAPVGTLSADSSNPIIVGNNAATGGVRATDGLLSDLRYYGRILTPAEIASLFGGIEPAITNLGLRWKLNEGGGTTAIDSSGNINTGTILGASFSSAFPSRPQLNPF